MAHWNRFKRDKRKESPGESDASKNRSRRNPQGGQRRSEPSPRPEEKKEPDAYLKKLPMQRASEFIPEKNHPGRPWDKPKVDIVTEIPPRRCAVAFFDSIDQARNAAEQLKSRATDFDELNIVVKNEADMTDPMLTSVGRFFAGAAWYLIHQRRVEEGYYHEKLS